MSERVPQRGGPPLPRQRSAGLSLLETLIALALSMVLLTSLFVLYYGAARGAAKEEKRSSADSEARLITRRLARDFKLVGLMGPEDVDGDSNDIRRDVPNMPWSDSLRNDFEYANTYELVFTSDVDDDSVTETVRYYRDDVTETINEQIWKWNRDSLCWTSARTGPVANHIDFLMFRYYDKDGNTIPNPETYPPGGYTLGAGERGRVTMVEVTVVTRSIQQEGGNSQSLSMPDGTYWYDSYRRVVSRFMVRGRNLSLGV
jgi:type II secretory pathway pseudopilin PulG